MSTDSKLGFEEDNRIEQIQQVLSENLENNKPDSEIKITQLTGGFKIMFRDNQFAQDAYPNNASPDINKIMVFKGGNWESLNNGDEKTICLINDFIDYLIENGVCLPKKDYFYSISSFINLFDKDNLPSDVEPTLGGQDIYATNYYGERVLFRVDSTYGVMINCNGKYQGIGYNSTVNQKIKAIVEYIVPSAIGLGDQEQGVPEIELTLPV